MKSSAINLPGLLSESQRQAAHSVGRAGGKVEATIHDGLVVLHFEIGGEYAAFAPLGALAIGAKMMLLAAHDKDTAQPAIDLAMAIIDQVYELRGDLKPAGTAVKHELIERHRRTLSARVRNILATFRENRKTSHAELARTIVDAMLNEVFQ